MAKSKRRIGYIYRYWKGSDVGYRFREDTYQKKMTIRGEKVYCKMLNPTYYEDVQLNTEIIKERGLILVGEPFFVDDEIREKVMRRIECANKYNHIKRN